MQKTPNLSLVYGEASFMDHKPVRVKRTNGAEEDTMEKIYLSTRACSLTFPRLKDSGYYTSTMLLDIRELPPQLIVMGGSYLDHAPGHCRVTYRNFFRPHLRWQYTGIRLAGG